MTEVPTGRRLVIYERDQWACIACGKALGLGDRQLQHRVPGKMGGRFDKHRFSAMILLCGFSATDPDGCHTYVERYRVRAQAAGYLVPEGTDPTTWPVRYSDLHGGGMWLLDDMGDRMRVA